jgi:peroxygenase
MLIDRLPDPRFPIIIKNIDRCKHGSDSETYDGEGSFVPQKFEEVFSKYSTSRKDALNAKDIQGMLKGNRNILDPTGWTAGALEW